MSIRHAVRPCLAAGVLSCVMLLAGCDDELHRARQESLFLKHRTPTVALEGALTANVLGLSAGATVVSLDELKEQATSPKASVRRVVALALRRLPGDLAPAVLRGLLSDPDASVRKQAVWSLGAVGGPADIPIVVPLLKDPVEKVRDYAAFTLARFGDRRGTEETRRISVDPKRPVVRREQALLALARRPSERAGDEG